MTGHEAPDHDVQRVPVGRAAVREAPLAPDRAERSSDAQGLRQDDDALAPRAQDRWCGALAAVVVLAGGLWMVATERGAPAGAIALAAVAAVAPALWRIDVRLHRLPNCYTLPVAAFALLAAVVPALGGDAGPILVALAIGGGLLVLSIVGGLGMGDVKLGIALAAASAALRADLAVVGLVMALLLGGLGGVVALVRRRRRLAFGPFLIAGFALAFVLVLVRG